MNEKNNEQAQAQAQAQTDVSKDQLAEAVQAGMLQTYNALFNVVQEMQRADPTQRFYLEGLMSFMRTWLVQQGVRPDVFYGVKKGGA